MKILVHLLVTLGLVILPFAVGIAISGFTPYHEPNSFQRYVILWASVSVVIAIIPLLLVKYFNKPFHPYLVAGGILFLTASPILGIVGLSEPPDLSVAMLAHPEREHFRYMLLFMAAAFFALFYWYLLKDELLRTTGFIKWTIIVLFIAGLAEFTWEFTHHYRYPEAFATWMANGGKADAFATAYDNFNVIALGVAGRIIQFSLISLTTLRLYHLRLINTWAPVLITIISLLGIVSANVILVTAMHIPKGYELLYIFFIPGIPFLLLYWLGVALLRRVRRR